MTKHLKKLSIHTYRVKQRNLYIKSRLGLADRIKRDILLSTTSIKKRLLKLYFD